MGVGTRSDRRWESLLSWLEGKHSMNISPHDGLLVGPRDTPGAGSGLYLLRDCQPSTTLFTVPAQALINANTLASKYPPITGGRQLTAVQMISLHLFLHKPNSSGISQDPDFGPFISTMPSGFDSHPLVWFLGEELGQKAPVLEQLLSILPSHVMQSVRQLSLRFWSDWEAICEYAVGRCHFKLWRDAARLTSLGCKELSNTLRSTSQEGINATQRAVRVARSLRDYLWAWLNVNTRSIYYRVDSCLSSPGNITLCPILDFANHTPSSSDIVPVISGHGSTKRGGNYRFESAAGQILRRGQDIHLRYGSHSNQVLLVEYGFVCSWEIGAVESGKVGGQVNLQEIIEALFQQRGVVGIWMKKTLQNEGYWGGWTMHSAPVPAHPSYQLATALRLYHCCEGWEEIPEHVERLVEPWARVIQGVSEHVSEENERKWRSLLLDLCRRVEGEAEEGLRNVGGLKVNQAGVVSPERPWLGWARENVRLLWQEELEVARALMKSIYEGESF